MYILITLYLNQKEFYSSWRRMQLRIAISARITAAVNSKDRRSRANERVAWSGFRRPKIASTQIRNPVPSAKCKIERCTSVQFGRWWTGREGGNEEDIEIESSEIAKAKRWFLGERRRRNRMMKREGRGEKSAERALSPKGRNSEPIH